MRVENHLSGLVRENVLPLCSSFPTVLQLYYYSHYIHGQCSNELHPLIPPVQHFTAATCYLHRIESPSFHHIPNLRKFLSGIFSPKNCYFVEYTPARFVSLNTTILASSSKWSVVISSPYPHNLHFPAPPPSFILHNSFIITISPVTLYLEWSLSLTLDEL